MYPVLQSYFLSTEELPKIFQNFYTGSELSSSGYSSKFFPFAVKKRLNKFRKEGEDAEYDKFVDSMLSIYQKTNEYSKKWSKSLRHLQEFEWLSFKSGKELKYESVEKTLYFAQSKTLKCMITYCLI